MATAKRNDDTAAPAAWHVLAVLSLGLLGAALYQIFFVAPVEEQMGIVQKIFYLHVPCAYGMYVGFTVASVGGLLYLWKREARWDALAMSGAEVGVLFTAIVLVTGPLWGRKAWGAYWVWDPRLTSTLLTGLIYTSYIGLRSFGQPGEVEKRFAAALALVGFPLLFLIKYSVQRWSGQHPIVISNGGGGLHEDMVPALVMMFLAITAIAVWLLWARFRVARQTIRIEELEQDLVEQGRLEEA